MFSPENLHIQLLELLKQICLLRTNVVIRTKLIRHRQHSRARKWRREIIKSFTAVCPQKRNYGPLKLQLIFQDHDSTATDYFKCHCFFSPLKRLNSLNVVGGSSKKSDIFQFFFSLQCNKATYVCKSYHIRISLF